MNAAVRVNFMATVFWCLFSLVPFSVLAIAYEDCCGNEEEIKDESLVHVHNMWQKSDYSEGMQFRFVDWYPWSACPCARVVAALNMLLLVITCQVKKNRMARCFF